MVNVKQHKVFPTIINEIQFDMDEQEHNLVIDELNEVKKFSDKRINSTPSIFNKSITKGFFKFLISFFWNSLFPTSEIVKSDRNFREFGFGVGSVCIMIIVYIIQNQLFHELFLSFPLHEKLL